MIIKKYTYNWLLPAFEIPGFSPLVLNGRLPVGGPTGTGGTFSAGLVLGCVGGAAQSEVATLTLGGGPAGNVIATWTGDQVYSWTFAYNATAAVMQAALVAAIPEWNGNVTVTGTPGTTYIITFNNVLASTRIGGLFAATIDTGTSVWARTTRGSAGAGQYDKYLNAGTLDTPTTAQRVLQWDYRSDPGGGQIYADSGSTGQPFSPPMYCANTPLNVADLTGLDSNAMNDPGFRLLTGAAITDTGAQIILG